MERGKLVVKSGQHISVHCGYPHRAPEISGTFFFTEDTRPAEEVLKEEGWHKSRKYGWLCWQKHNWKGLRGS